MKIETLEISGFRSALEALRLPYDLDCRSFTQFALVENETEISTESHVKVDARDVALLRALIQRGDEHAKVLRGVIVWTKITAPIYWWTDLETYKVGHERLMSGSTMNKECKGLTGEELQKVKGKIPYGREITKIDYFSYQTLRRIYLQRKEHRLPEFHQFCEWIETLPYASEFIIS